MSSLTSSLAQVAMPLTVPAAMSVMTPAAKSLIGAVPARTRSPPNTWRTTSAPIIGPNGLNVVGFRMDPATIKGDNDHQMIEESLMGAITMAQIASKVLRDHGSHHPNYQRLFKNEKYFNVVLAVFQRIADLMPLRTARNPPLGNVTLTRGGTASDPADAKGAFIKQTTTIELHREFWEKSWDLPVEGKQPTEANFSAWQQQHAAKKLEPLSLVYGSRALVLLHEMVHLISVGMPSITDICKKNQSMFLEKAQEGHEVDHIDDMQFGDIYSPRTDKDVFTKILIPDSDSEEDEQGKRTKSDPRVADRKKREGYAYGLDLTKMLAKLGMGDIGAVLNADSYAVFATVAYCDAAGAL